MIPHPISAVPSGYPQNFTGNVASPWNVTLAWDPPLPSEQNGPLTSFTINMTRLESGEMNQLMAVTTSLSVAIRPYSTYTFFIAATNIVGRGPFSTAITVRIPENGNHVYSLPQQMILLFSSYSPYTRPSELIRRGYWSIQLPSDMGSPP